MPFRQPSRALAATLSLALMLSLPGRSAWAALAGTVRPAPGAGLPGAAGAARPAAGALGPSVLTTSLSGVPGAPAMPFLPPALSLPHAAAPSAAPLAPAAPLAAAPLAPIAPLAASPAAPLAAAPRAPASAPAANGARARLSGLDAGQTPAPRGFEAADAPGADPARALFDGATARPRMPAVEGAGAAFSGAARPALAPAARGSAPLEAPKLPGFMTKEAQKPAAPAPAREPFIPASVKVTALENLVRSDPAAALALAGDYLLRETDKRPEVRIASLRALEALPPAMALPVYLQHLEQTASQSVQLSKAGSLDKWWYEQREVLRRIGSDAAALSPASAALESALRAAYKDRNPSVRLMAGDVLRKLGLDPGPEPDLSPVPGSRGERAAAPASGGPSLAAKAPQEKKGPRVWLWAVRILCLSMLAWSLASTLKPNAPRDPSMLNRPAATQPAQTKGAPQAAPQKTQPLPSEAVEKALKSKTPQRVTLEELERIASAAERSAAAAEQANREAAAAREESGKISFLSLFLTFGPIVLIFWLLGRMAKGAGQGGFGEARTGSEKPSVRFHDVAGIDESMVEVEEIVDYLRNPQKYAKVGARVPKGVLLEGPPGTGKTLLAKALAGETNANFLSMSGSDFVQMYVGVGASRVRDLFEQAKKARPAVIFIDEIDAVGKQRGSGGMHSNDEREQTINALLSAMDGFTDSTGIIVVAATNRADLLDTALTRPGRFDRKIHVGLPEQLGREAILALHARKVRLAPDADLKYVARRTTGLSGAFLENVVIEAARLAARRGADEVRLEDLDEGVDRATIGAKRSLKLSDKLKLRIARHEAGHVLANLLNEDPELRQPTNKVTIVPHGTGALGFAEMGGQEGDTYLYTKRELEARLDHAMGGLVAEKLYYGEWSTGPGSDLQYATRIARTMVQNLGMDESLGFPQTAPDANAPAGRPPFGDAVLAQVHEAAKKVIQQSYERVLKRFHANRQRLDAMSQALMEKETLISSEIERYAYGELPPAPPAAPQAPRP